MNRLSPSLLALCLSFTAQSAGASDAPTVAPAVGTYFSLPLADATQTRAILLQSPQSLPVLVYATPTGQLGLWTLTRADSPSPPRPPVVDPPAPPRPSTNLSLITITAAEPATIPKEVGARLAALDSAFFAYTIAMVGEPNPPANSLTWIGRTANKELPYSFLADKSGVILWQGPTPTDAAGLLGLLPQPAKPAVRRLTCTGPNCPNQGAPVQ